LYQTLRCNPNGRAGRTAENPPAGEEEFLLDLLINRVPPGVDEAAYVKAGFLAAIAKGEATSPLVTLKKPLNCWAPCRVVTTFIR
jgi:aconitate hydratase 2/2-methylisocitrate dehydratase